MRVPLESNVQMLFAPDVVKAPPPDAQVFDEKVVVVQLMMTTPEPPLAPGVF